MMKKILYSFMMLFIGLSLVSCGDDDDLDIPNPEPGLDGDFSVKEEKMIGLVAEGYEATISFDATENWRAKSNVDWITVSPTRGTKGSVQMAIKIEENTTTEERSGELILETVSKSQTFYKVYVTQKGRAVVNNPDENDAAPAGMKKNATALVREMKVGWNLGNTLEATDEWIDSNTGDRKWDSQCTEGGANLVTETKWQSVKTTKEMFTALKNAGFNGIRIPVRWYRHADADMNINAAWMARVKEIVDYAISQDMYVILNSHHDNWYDRMLPTPDAEGMKAKFGNMWKQIANAFKDYDEHLIFAAVNEVIIDKNGPWTNGEEVWPWVQNNAIVNGPTDAQQNLFDQMIQAFVDEVRATGGNNQWRNLMVQPWAASSAIAVYGTVNMPKDKVENRLIFEYHCYDPYNYATAKTQHDLTESDKTYIKTLFKKINERFVEKGIPCIMAEFGSTQDNSDGKKEAEFDKTRADYLEFVVSEAKKYNIPGFYWDNNAFTGNGENFGLLDRKNCTFPARAKVALDGIMRGIAK